MRYSGVFSAAAQLLGGIACATAAAGLVQLAPVFGAAAEPAPSAAGPAEVPAAPARAEPAAPLDSEAAVASYDLSARLDATTHTILAEATVRWTNTSNRAVEELWLHLYLNAFKNERSLYLRSPFGAGRSGVRARDWGYVDVRRLVARELGGVDLWPARDPHSPGDPDDQTDIRVPLPEPVAPGESLTLDLDFEAQLPAIVERTGYSGSFHFVAQWFPKLARLLPDGTWAHFAFHPQSEFYADFGDYTVTLDVPERMRVGATGQRTQERISAGRKIVRHEARQVHDFAWTAWDGFQERRERIADVDVRLLYPAGHDTNAETSLEAVRFALPHFSAHYGRYPYPGLTIVHPPEHARAAGGMEYPTLITTGGPWYASYLVRAVEGVTVHELAHQWFYGLVASDEHRWPFLDEGLTSFAESVALQRRYGPGSLVHLPGLSIAQAHASRAFALRFGHGPPITTAAAEFPSFHSIGAVVYARTTTLLRTLAGVYSEPAMLRALGSYARRHRFGHPDPEDLLRAVREEVGPQAEAALRVGLFERGWVDYSVTTPHNARVNPPGGVFDSAGARQTRHAEASAPDAPWVGRAIVLRRGTLRLPVEIELITEDGSRSRQTWDGQGDWTRVEHHGASRLVGVVVDPERRVALDEDLLNNARQLYPQTPRRVTELSTYAAQLLLSWLGP